MSPAILTAQACCGVGCHARRRFHSPSVAAPTAATRTATGYHSRRVHAHAIPAPEPACHAALRADNRERTRGRPCGRCQSLRLVAAARIRTGTVPAARLPQRHLVGQRTGRRVASSLRAGCARRRFHFPSAAAAAAARRAPATRHTATDSTLPPLLCSHTCIAPAGERLTSTQSARLRDRLRYLQASPLLLFGTVTGGRCAEASRRKACRTPSSLRKLVAVSMWQARRPFHFPSAAAATTATNSAARSRSRRCFAAIPAPEPACHTALRADTQERPCGRP